LYFAVLEDIVIDRVKIRTPEQRTKKMLNEERTVIDLQLAIKKEQFRNYLNTRPEFHEGYEKVDKSPHDCWVFT
jgi:hypothetical protein